MITHSAAAIKAIAAFALCATVAAGISLSYAQAAASAATALPKVSRCELETTQRVAFRVDDAPQIVGLRFSFYDSHNAWMADELVWNEGISAPILPIAGLFDPHKVANVKCTIDGYVATLDQFGFQSIASSGAGRKTCPVPGGLFVDGGPDSMADVVMVGRDWLMFKTQVFINHFFPNEESALAGDILWVSLDHGPGQQVVVTGEDPQYVSLLFTNIRHGFHEIDYAPWFHSAVATTNGYHTYCVRT